MPDTDYDSMLRDLKALPKTRNPLKLVQRFLLKDVISQCIKHNIKK